MTKKELAEWERKAKSGPHPVIDDRPGHRYQRRRKHRALTEADAASTPDWNEIDAVFAILSGRDSLLPPDYNEARRYVGDTINLTVLQRIIIASCVLLSPPLSQRAFARAMGVSQPYVTRQFKAAMEKIRAAPPAFAVRRMASRMAKSGETD